MKKKREQTEIFGWMLEKSAEFYVMYMLVVFPIYYRNKLFDIATAKRDAYLFGTGCFLLTALLLGAGYVCAHLRRRHRADTWKENRSLYLFLALFAAASAIGTLCSGAVSDSFWGLTGVRCVGSAVLLSGVLIILLIGRFLKWNRALTACFLFGGTFQFVLEICNLFQIDPLRMTQTMLDQDRPSYIGTIGNLNYVAIFNTMAVVAGMSLYCLCGERRCQIAFAIFLFLGYAAVFCTRSDGGLLGVSTAFCVMFGCALFYRRRVERVLHMGLLLFASMCAVSLFDHLFRAHAYPIGGLAGMLLRPRALLAFGMALAALVLFFRFAVNTMQNYGAIFRIYMGAVLACLGIAALLLLAANTDARAATGFLSSLRFDDRFGSGRGGIWRNAIRLYGEYPLFQKLFGCGMNCLGNVSAQSSVGYMSDAHNEFLHMLDSVGLAGAVGYFGMQIALWRKSLKTLKENETALFGVAGIAAYAVQALVNGPEIMTMPLYFVQLGVCLSIVNRQ